MRNTVQTVQWSIFTAVLALVCAATVTGPLCAAAQDPRQPDSYNSTSGVPPEKPPIAPTAADRAMTQKIRKAIVADKSLSADGRRVKVTTLGGKVTLQGVAKSEAERTSLFTKAADVAGGTNVVNNVTVSAEK
jgi:hyperosmotically inducible periplasmic protein